MVVFGTVGRLVALGAALGAGFAAADAEAPTVTCVTGGSGFLAMELVAQLLETGYFVRASVRSLANKERIAPFKLLPHQDRLEVVEADLLKPGSFDKCANGAKFLFHTASPFITSGITDAQKQLIEPAVEGTRNVLQSALKGGVSRVVMTSSIAALMGKLTDKESCFDEDDWNYSSRTDGDGQDQYRLSKTMSEQLAWDFAEANSLELATILPSFIVGPPRTPRTDGVSLGFMAGLLDGKEPSRGSLPTIDLRDCAAAHVAAAETPEAAGQRFITSSGPKTDNNAIIRLLQDELPQVDFVQPPAPLADNEVVFCTKNLRKLSIKLRPWQETMVDMAKAMLANRPQARSEL